MKDRNRRIIGQAEDVDTAIGPGEPGGRDFDSEAHGLSFQYLLCNDE